jgi:putative efflux protein, MATE family
MTTGSPAKLLLKFALPLMLGNICQQLYTIVDTAVVGKFVGVEALASLGAADWLNWMVLSTVIGFTQGFSIPAAQRFGAKDMESLRKTCGASYILTAIIAVALTIVGQLGMRPMLKLLRTPENVVAGTETYLRIMFASIVVIAGYNILAAMLRALGDSKTPLIAMIVSAAINVVLDIIFVVPLKGGIAGAAIATVMAQCVSFLWCLRAILKIKFLKLNRSHLTLERGVVYSLFKLGTPLALQNIIIAVGGLAVQYVINGFGFIFLAGFTATNKLFGLLDLAATAFGFSIMTFAGQNMGANQFGRIKKGVRAALAMALSTSAVISAVVIIFGRQIVSIFISAAPETAHQVTEIAYEYLSLMGVFLSILYSLHIHRSTLQGMGDTITPMASGIIELIMRILSAIFLPLMFGPSAIFYAEILAWVGAVVILTAKYQLRIRKLT